MATDANGYTGDIKKYQGQAKSYMESDSLLKQDIKGKAIGELKGRVGGFEEVNAIQDYKKQADQFDPMNTSSKLISCRIVPTGRIS